MGKNILLRRIIALPLIAVLLSGILSAGIYILSSRWTYADIRAEELIPVARAVAGLVADGQPNEMDISGIWNILDQENKLFGATLHVYGTDGKSVSILPGARPRDPNGPGPGGNGRPERKIEPEGNTAGGNSGPRRKGYMELTPEETHQLITDDLQDILAGAEVAKTRAFLGQSYLVAGAPVHGGEQLAGAVVLTRPMREIDGAMHKLNLVLVISTATAFLIMLVPAYLAAKRLVVPIRQMQDVARAMAQGNFTLRADESSKGELGELARAMNHFAVESERLEQTRRDYVANVSHELRTPIASIRAMGETLRDGMARTDEKKTLFYNNIVRESLRLSRLVDDLLELSRLQAGTEGLQKTTFDLREVLQNVVDIYDNSTAAQTNRSFILSADMSHPIEVCSNADRIEQVLIILLDNAMKHTPAGGTITLAATTIDGKKAVSVENTGEAIPPEDLPHLFERFYKVDKSHSGSGTGLGLSIANEILKHLGGNIVAESRPDGMRFVFTLT